MKALIDADIVSFSCAIYNEEWGWEACREDIDQLIKRILETTGANDYSLYISGANNFRYDVDPDYKANRKGKPDPIYRQEANAYLVTEYGARVTNGVEADDGLGTESTQLSADGVDNIICTIDKDLKMIPGQHYNWRKNEFEMVSPLDALRRFYKQLLTGDRTDNVMGIGGIGPVKSSRIIDDLEDEVDMFSTVQTMYNDDQRLLKNANLLWILQEEDKIWTYVAEEKGLPIDTTKFRLVVGNGPTQ